MWLNIIEWKQWPTPEWQTQACSKKFYFQKTNFAHNSLNLISNSGVSQIEKIDLKHLTAKPTESLIWDWSVWKVAIHHLNKVRQRPQGMVQLAWKGYCLSVCVFLFQNCVWIVTWGWRSYFSRCFIATDITCIVSSLAFSKQNQKKKVSKSPFSPRSYMATDSSKSLHKAIFHFSC